MTNRSLRLCSVILTIVILINMIPRNAVADEEAIFLDISVEGTNIPAEKIVEEVEENRTEFTKAFKLNNGLYVSAVYAQPVHYQEDGVWKEIDNTLRAHLDGTYSNTAGLWEVRFPQQLSGNNAITITKDGYTLSFAMAGELRVPVSLEIPDSLQTTVLETEFENLSVNGTDLTFSVLSAQTAQGQIQAIDLTQVQENAEYEEFVLRKNASQLLYSNVYTNTDIQYDLKSNQVKESIILESYNNTLRGYRYTLNVGNMIPVLQEDNSIYFYDANREKIVMVMPAPYMVDADDQYNYDVQVSLTGSGSTRTLIYLLPTSWLAAAERSWPVVLDPVVTPQIDIMNIRDHTVASNGSYSMYRYVLECGYGPSSHIHRIFLKYRDLPVLSSTDVITKANVQMYKLDNTSNSSGTMEVHKVLANWETDTLSWNNKPAYDTSVEDSVVIGNGSGYFTWEVTDIARDWYTRENYGMMFKMDDATEAAGGNSWKHFYASDHGVTAYMPSLTIEYQGEDTLSVSSSVNVNITTVNEQKYFSFIPTSSGKYIFQSSNSTGDPKVWLYNSSYTLLDVDDDAAGNNNFRLGYDLEAYQTYHIAAGHFDTNTGSYTLTVLKPVNLDNRFYRLSNYGSNMYLDIHGPAEQTYVHQWTSHTGEQQKWLIQKQSDGYYTIRSQYGNNYYVGIYTMNTGEDNIRLFPSISDVTRWNIYITAAGEYIFEPKLALGKSLYAPDDSSGTEMRLAWMGTGENNDKWLVYPYTYSEPTFSAFDIGNSVSDEVAVVKSGFESFGLTDIGSYKNDDGFIPGQLVKDIGKYSDIVYINAHGGQRSNLFVQECGSDTHEKEEYLCADESVDVGDGLNKIGIGAQWKSGSTTKTDSYWNAGTKWVIISSCDQFNYVGDRFGAHWNGLYSAQVWARTMLGDGERIHGFLGYCNGAPPEDAHTTKLESFFHNAQYMPIIDAWKSANLGGWPGQVNTNWAIMYHSENASDTLDSFTDSTNSNSPYSIYLERFTYSNTIIPLASASNNVSANALNLNANAYPVFIDADVSEINSIYTALQGKLLVENSQLKIDEHNRIIYNNFDRHTGEANLGFNLSDKQAVAAALQQLDALGIAPDGDYKVSVSYVHRYEMDLNSGAVSAPETIEYSVCFNRTYNGIDMLSDQGDGIVVSFDKYGLTNLQYKWRDVQVVTDAELMSASAVTSTQAKNIYLAAVEEDAPDVQVATNTGETLEPVVTQAYLEIDNEVRPVWVCSPEGGYGNHIFIDMQTGEQLTVA